MTKADLISKWESITEPISFGLESKFTCSYVKGAQIHSNQWQNCVRFTSSCPSALIWIPHRLHGLKRLLVKNWRSNAAVQRKQKCESWQRELEAPIALARICLVIPGLTGAAPDRCS